MKRFAQIVVRVLRSLIGAKILQNLAYLLASQVGIGDPKRLGNLMRIGGEYDPTLLEAVYQNMGILKHGDHEISGEQFVLQYIVGPYASSKTRFVVLDVGANTGSYCDAVIRQIPNAEIYAIEPNPSAFELLRRNVQGNNIRTFNIGVGAKTGVDKIYAYRQDHATQLASRYREAFSQLHRFNGELVQESDIIEIEMESVTLRDFCRENGIETVDFLKIDVEGNELEVLKSGNNMIVEDKIHIIQFEFNELNVLSRVFLKDFYDLLPQYEMFRIDSNRLIPLGAYDSVNEIFKYQNILAINTKLVPARRAQEK